MIKYYIKGSVLATLIYLLQNTALNNLHLIYVSVWFFPLFESVLKIKERTNTI